MSSMPTSSQYIDTSLQRAWVQRVYAWMMGGLLCTAATSALVYSIEPLFVAIFGNMLLRWVFMLLPLGMVIFLSTRLHAMKASTAMGTFIAFSIANGLSLSWIFFVYELGSIASVFVSAAAMFGAASVYGYVTNRDLTSMGSFMTMGVFGIIIASIINIFMQSSVMGFAINIIGVIVFTCLTAYHMQRIKDSSEMALGNSSLAAKTAIMGALSLYLDFINLFIFLLRLLGNRR